MRLYAFAVAAVLLSASLAARADTTDYTVSLANFSSGSNGTFSFEEPTLQTADFSVGASQFLTNTNANITTVFFAPEGGSCGYVGSTNDCISVSYSGGNTIITSFSQQFASYGHFSNGNVTLDVTDVAATPEPSSFILLGTGLLGVAGVVRRRFV